MQGGQAQYSSFMEDGGSIDYPQAQAGTIAEKSVGQFCGIQRGINKENARMNAEASRDAAMWAKQAERNEKILAKEEAAKLAGELNFDYDWMGSPVEKPEKKAAMAAYKQFFQDNPNTFVADDTSGFSPEQKYIIASKLKQKISTPVYGKNFQQQYGVDPRTLDLQRLQSQMAPRMGGWEGMRNYLFNKKEDGGWVSNDWQPQVIASFGEHKMKDLLKPPHDAEMLRAGGHLKAYTPPSERAMSTERPMMQMGGELETHWGGYAEPMSYNPYLPDGGETIMFRGQSHDESDGRGNTGIGITYGDNPVEVERGEPALKLQDGGSTGDSSLVVFGNLKIPKAYVPFLGKEAEGKKFKTYVADLSKKENKINKNISKAVEELDELDVQDSFDKLKFNRLDLTINGGNAQLKDIADSKTSAASLQNAINDTAEEYGLIADDLAKGKVVTAKHGKSIPKAQGGYKSKYGLDPWTGDKTTGIKNASAYTAQEWDEIAEQIGFDKTGKKGNKAFQEYLFADPELKAMIIDNHQRLYNSDPTSTKKNWFDNKLGAGWAAPGLKAKELPDITVSTFKPRPFKPIIPSVGDTPKKDIPTTEYTRSGLLDVIGQVLPYVRPTDQEDLDPNQLMGEMYALATNQLEPVQAQTLQPQLDVPYDISLQDQLNENEATFRSQQRLIGYNPALQAQLNAQKYTANQRTLAEQFRMNQALKNQVYRDNRNLLNQFNLQNLAILDKQYERQEMAKSKTKATNLEALKSIGDKYLRNQLENRTLATMENLYNYRFDPRFRAINMNAPYQPVIPTIAGTTAQRVPVLDQNGNILYYEQKVGDKDMAVVSSPATTPGTPQTEVKRRSNKEEIEIGKKGVSVKKNNMNSSILKAFKNI